MRADPAGMAVDGAPQRLQDSWMDEAILERLRRSGIRIDREGELVHEGEVVRHQGLRQAIFRWPVAIAVLLLCGCARPRAEILIPTSDEDMNAAAVAEEHPLEAGRKISCSDWHRVPIAGTGAVIVNNVWNKQAAGGRPHEQCLRERDTAGGKQHGWSWSWPPYKPFASYAAPEVLFGWKPWDGGASTTPELPRRLDQLQSLEVEFGVEKTRHGHHNLNLTMWLTGSDEATASPRPGDITNEVMVWFDNPEGLGRVPWTQPVTLGGLEFDVWHQKNHADSSGANRQTWTMSTYLCRTPMLEGRFDLKAVLDDLVKTGNASRSSAVGVVELITEVFGGSGQLWLRRFEVRVQPSRL